MTTTMLAGVNTGNREGGQRRSNFRSPNSTAFERLVFRPTKKRGGPHTRRWWTAPHAGYPESGDLLPLFFFLPPPLGLLRPR